MALVGGCPNSEVNDQTPSGDDDSSPGVNCEIALDVPTERIWPEEGELFYQQVGLGGFSLGESAIVVGPTGKVVLIDVGNNSHDDDIATELTALLSNMNANGGYANGPFATNEIDHAIITHMHADHSDGLGDLLMNWQLQGKIIHRGLVDITAAAGESAVEQLCGVLAANPQADFPICVGTSSPPCTAGQWVGTYPATGCPGLDAGDIEVDGDSGRTVLDLGGGAQVEVLAANATIGSERYVDIVGPLHQSDSNGENARSVTGVVQHGAFRLLFAGDLTGGGSDTDAVEGFYAERFSQYSEIGPLGVDVLHAGHHGRDTSSSLPWVNALLPIDGRSRNVVIGISTAHLDSPHTEPIANLLDSQRLTDGFAWTTDITIAGSTHPRLLNANGGQVLIKTTNSGSAYTVQLISDTGDILQTQSYWAVGYCLD